MAEIKIDKETGEKIRELQLGEQSLQTQLLQKQAFQFELDETLSALEEIKKAKDNEVYKISGQIMIKAKKEDLEKDLSEKIDILTIRIKAIEKQDMHIQEKLDKLKGEISRKLNKEK